MRPQQPSDPAYQLRDYYTGRLDDAHTRVAHIEGELRHYATKAELSETETRLGRMEPRLMRWMIGLMVGSAAVAASIVFIVIRLLD